MFIPQLLLSYFGLFLLFVTINVLLVGICVISLPFPWYLYAQHFTRLFLVLFFVISGPLDIG